MNKEIAKQEINRLIKKYNEIVRDKEIKKYNEERTKAEFIEPLFEALGWDVRNKTHKDEVTREEKISKKRVDYGFRINGIPKFFLEAKSFKENLDTPKFIEQAINYAWHKGCTWAILTNFKTIKIFNAEWKTKNLLQNRFKEIRYEEFLDRFDELWALSKEGFEKKLLDKEAEKYGKRTKRISIDKQLLSDFTIFREMLSKNILKNNPNISKKLLDECVQRILDRLIFIRVCEDREIEPQILLPKVRDYEEKWMNMKKVFSEVLTEIFREFDYRYNSRLFREHESEKLKIDSLVLIKIIKSLYGNPEKMYSYDFSIIDADVLGNIYEQYLGYIIKGEKKIRLAKERKHRKEQGIYYTPTYIVDYIVKNTVTEFTKNKNLDQILEVKILDPACGSGSFLIRTFSELCNIIEDRLKKGERSKKILSFKTYNGKLSISQKIYILMNCIFGVDLDERAVEIAQLNLLLKILEGESRKTLSNIKQMKKLLPMLENIKYGNSLINDEKIAGNKAFKWQEEFKEVMSKGGFDIVIGNPPYIDYREINETEFIKKHYYSAKVKDKYNILILFIEKGLNLIKNGGLLGFIVSNQFLCSDFGLKIREFILKNTKIKQIIDVSMIKIFNYMQ